nr:MAG TPA: hypothetical protein [Caudoviricetes sp.]
MDFSGLYCTLSIAVLCKLIEVYTLVDEPSPY